MSERTQCIDDFHRKLYQLTDTVEFDWDIQNIAVDLRSSVNDVLEPWSDAIMELVIQYLKDRIRLWQEPSDAMDMHVKGMVQQAILIGEGELIRRKAVEAK